MARLGGTVAPKPRSAASTADVTALRCANTLFSTTALFDEMGSSGRGTVRVRVYIDSVACWLRGERWFTSAPLWRCGDRGGAAERWSATSMSTK
jgi:hypothetical protein